MTKKVINITRPSKVKKEKQEVDIQNREVIVEITEIRKEMADLREQFDEVHKSMLKMLTIFYAAEGFVKVMNWMGIAAIMVGKLSAGILIAYLAAKGVIKGAAKGFFT